MGKLSGFQWFCAAIVGAIVLDQIEKIAAAFGSGQTYDERQDAELAKLTPAVGIFSRIAGK